MTKINVRVSSWPKNDLTCLNCDTISSQIKVMCSGQSIVTVTIAMVSMATFLIKQM